MKQLTLLILSILSYANSFAQLWIPSEKYGEGQYWESDAYNFQSYPYTIFNHANGLTIEQQKINLKSQ